MKELTKAEEQVMRYLWKLEKAFLKDIIDEFPEPKPAYTTVSTVIRVLVKKKFILYNTYGKVHEYYPAISKTDYFRIHFKGVVKNFFSGSVSSFASCFTDDEDISLTELEEMKKMIEDRMNQLSADDE